MCHHFHLEKRLARMRRGFDSLRDRHYDCGDEIAARCPHHRRSRRRPRARAVARPWRAGARGRDFGRRRGGALRQLRFLRDPLVADAQRRRTGAALPRRRGECGRAARRRPRRHRPARTAASRSGATASRSPTRCCRDTPRRSSRSRVSPDGATLASASWDHTVRLWPLAGGSAARARRPHAERQRRRVHAGRQGGGERGLRSHAAHLAARRRRADHRDLADAAQRGRGRARRRDRRGRRERQGVFPRQRGRSRTARCRPRRRR